MKLSILFIVITTITIITVGCESSVERAQKNSHKATENVANERIKLVDEYRSCVENAGDDAVKVEACDSYLKAAEALH